MFSRKTSRAQNVFNTCILSHINLKFTLSHFWRSRKVVFFFSDGWNEVDRAHVYGLIGSNYLVHLFFTSPGKASKDRFRNASSILEFVNGFHLPHNNDGAMCPFMYLGNMRVKLHGSGAQKTLLVFMRINIPFT